MGWGLLAERQYDKAIEQLGKTLLLDPAFPRSRLWLGQAFEQKGEFGQAIAEFKKTVEITGNNSQYLATLGQAYAMTGKRLEAHEILKTMEDLSKHKYVSPYDRALVYAGLGDNDKAFASLEEAYRLRETWRGLINVDSRFDVSVKIPALRR